MLLETDIEQIKKNLSQLGSGYSPSEAHGLLCGLLCGKGDVKTQEWLVLAVDGFTDINKGDLLATEASELLSHFFSQTVAAFSDNNLKFYPLLPENEGQAACLEGIAQWAQGYLFGLSSAGLKPLSTYPDDVVDFIKTMISISSAGDYALAGDESDEEAMVELIEFIRIGVLLANEEMNPIRVPVDIPGNSIH
jgi:uncharacterized protein